MEQNGTYSWSPDGTNLNKKPKKADFARLGKAAALGFLF